MDHDEQVRRLAAAGQVRLTDCLDICDQANVVSPAGPFGGVLDRQTGRDESQPDVVGDVVLPAAA
ncbi:hypothetical protein [Acrocarpospora catenulata]|uniref:hypothetical protein n=1 Tax=Acrocarpospora catenulata TaxID=2836182 RepID=UPI001BDAF2E4|nr:hypothetical protein [Acrocarpospora catenulata]